MLDGQARDPSTSDQELISRVAKGDRDAFAELVERHAAAILRLTTALTGSSTSAEDALQQALLNAYRNAAHFRGDASVRTWLFTIARNAAYHLRAKSDHEKLVERNLMRLGIEAGWGSDDPEVIAIAAEQRAALQTAMSRLSSGDREVLLLRDLEGLRGSEAAEVLGISERAMKSRLHRARLRLAASLRALASPPAAADEGGPP